MSDRTTTNSLAVRRGGSRATTGCPDRQDEALSGSCSRILDQSLGSTRVRWARNRTRRRDGQRPYQIDLCASLVNEQRNPEGELRCGLDLRLSDGMQLEFTVKHTG